MFSCGSSDDLTFKRASLLVLQPASKSIESKKKKYFVFMFNGVWLLSTSF